MIKLFKNYSKFSGRNGLNVPHEMAKRGCEENELKQHDNNKEEEEEEDDEGSW